MIVAVEKLHEIGIEHNDLGFSNVVIDNKGHLMLTDFGLSDCISIKNTSKWDWKCLLGMGYQMYFKPIHDENTINLIDMLNNMTDSEISGN